MSRELEEKRFFEEVEYIGIYNRCSTEEEAQINALEIQAEESLELVSKHFDWKVVEQYIESQSGTSTKKRYEYNRMLEDIEANKFTIIVIKSIDRLARNTKDWYLFLDCITRNGVKLYLYLENKFYTPEDSLITGIKAILAEDFSRELSKKIKNAHKRRQEKKSALNLTREMFGWDKVGKDEFVINEEEANYYRRAYDLAEQGYGFRRIAGILAEQGARGKSGGRITEAHWRKMLRSERAYGTVILHKREFDFDCKKWIEIPKNEWIIVENALPAIINKEYYEKVMKILEKRAASYDHKKKRAVHTGKYELSGKVICGLCGKKYYRSGYQKKNGEKKPQWKCSEYLAFGRKKEDGSGCNNRAVTEDILYGEIDKFYEKQIKELLSEKERITEEVLEIIKKAVKGNENEKEEKQLEKKREKIKKEKEKLIGKFINDSICEKDFKSYNEVKEKELKEIDIKLTKLKEKNVDKEKAKERMEKIKKELIEGTVIEEALKKQARKQVKKIIVFEDGKIEVKME